jgi:hypothetical protein
MKIHAPGLGCLRHASYTFTVIDPAGTSPIAVVDANANPININANNLFIDIPPHDMIQPNSRHSTA